MELSARQIRAHRLRASSGPKISFWRAGRRRRNLRAAKLPARSLGDSRLLPPEKLHPATAAPGAVSEKGTAAGVEHSRRTADLPDGGQRRFPLCAHRAGGRGAVDLHQRNRPCARLSGDVLFRAAALGGERSRISGRSHRSWTGCWPSWPPNSSLLKNSLSGTPLLCTARPTGRRLAALPSPFCCGPAPLKGWWSLGNGRASPRPSPPRCAGLGTSWFHLHKAQPSLHAAFCTPTVPRRRAPLPIGWAALPLRQSGSGSRSRRSLNR